MGIFRYPRLCKVMYAVMLKKWDPEVYVNGLIDDNENKHWFLLYIYFYGANIADDVNLPSMLNLKYLENVKCGKLSFKVMIRGCEVTVFYEDGVCSVEGSEVFLDGVEFI